MIILCALIRPSLVKMCLRQPVEPVGRAYFVHEIAQLADLYPLSWSEQFLVPELLKLTESSVMYCI